MLWEVKASIVIFEGSTGYMFITTNIEFISKLFLLCVVQMSCRTRGVGIFLSGLAGAVHAFFFFFFFFLVCFFLVLGPKTEFGSFSPLWTNDLLKAASNSFWSLVNIAGGLMCKPASLSHIFESPLFPQKILKMDIMLFYGLDYKRPKNTRRP